jgi:UDP-glucuronate 4-epimerase
MAYYKFPLNALKNKKLFLNNNGNDFRDFTHVSDVVEGIKRLIVKAPKIKRSNIFNFGTNRPTKVKKILEILKKETKLNLKIENKKKNKLDPDITNANIKNAKKIFGYKATIYFDQGYKNFLKWFLEYHK